jgi:MFS superfamily sulfate permease-like transporter
MRHLIPFLATIIAILMTDLLIGIGIGCVFGLAFVLFQNMKSAMTVVNDGNNYLIRSKRDLFFMHKYELKRTLSTIPPTGRCCWICRVPSSSIWIMSRSSRIS